MERTFFYQQDQSSSKLKIPSAEKQLDIEEFMCTNLFDSSSDYSYLSEAIAPYQNSVSTVDPESNNVTAAMSDSVSSILDDKTQLGVHNSPKRRRAKDRSSGSTTSECKDSNGGRRKKQKRELGKKKEEMKAKLEAQPDGYIHVRARRGQATDSHSLAERVRREKISARMKMLQSLVPGCDNIVGKAQVLDEIINYVQCLQNQVEFLSMKLVSSEDQGILFEYCFDQDEAGIGGVGGMSYEEAPYGEYKQPNMRNGNGPTYTDLDYLMMNSHSPSHLLPPQALDHTSALSQDEGSAMLVQFGEPGQDLLNQLGFDSTF